MILKNIEIKAQISDYDYTRELIKTICPKSKNTEQQIDTFFNTNKGRLKLRETAMSTALIYYERKDSNDPSPSDIIISFVEDPATLKNVLSKALGIRGFVKKERTLYLYDQTRIHLDKVDNLGNFLELEVVLMEEQSPNEGVKIARDLMNKLKIKEYNLIDRAYIDLLEEVNK